MSIKKHHVSAVENLKSQFQQPATNVQLSAAGCRQQDSDYEPQASLRRPFVIPIFLPHAGCPYHCVFCNQVSITGAKHKVIKPDEVRSQIREFIKYKKNNRGYTEVAFFGGNFLGLKNKEIILLLETAAEFVGQGRVDGIRFSTRPDTIDFRCLGIIKDYPVSTVELGVQSMDDRALAFARRGHTAFDTVRAVELLRQIDLSVGLQMMVGLPGDEENGVLTTVQRIIELRPDFVRIYPTLVVSNSRLADWYKSGHYTPMSLEEAVGLVKKLYLKFNQAGIGVVRMGLQASEDLDDGTTVLAGPHHPAFGHLVHSEVFWDMAVSAIESAKFPKNTLTIFVNPRSVSKMRGMHNSNMKRLQSRFRLKSLAVKPEIKIPQRGLMIEWT